MTNTATIVSSDAAGPVSASDTVTVTPQSLGGGRLPTVGALSCSPSQLLLGQASTCTDVVANAAGTTVAPGGTVLFTSANGTFASPGRCALSSVAAHPGSSSCSITYTPTHPGTDTIGAGYEGDVVHLGSNATTTVASAPVAGKTATVAILSGKILIRLKNSNLYVPLSASGAISIPIGSTVDALNGTVSMTTAADTLSPTNHDHDADNGTFSEGLFAVKQAAKAAQGVPPPVDLVLQTPVGAVAHAKCTRTGRASRGVVRSLKGVVKGNYVAVRRRQFHEHAQGRVRGAGPLRWDAHAGGQGQGHGPLQGASRPPHAHRGAHAARRAGTAGQGALPGRHPGLRLTRRPAPGARAAAQTVWTRGPRTWLPAPSGPGSSRWAAAISCSAARISGAAGVVRAGVTVDVQQHVLAGGDEPVILVAPQLVEQVQPLVVVAEQPRGHGDAVAAAGLAEVADVGLDRVVASGRCRCRGR